MNQHIIQSFKVGLDAGQVEIWKTKMQFFSFTILQAG